MRFAPLLLTALASVAQAQSLDLSLQGNDELRVSATDCTTPIPISWTTVNAGQACDGLLKIWVTSRDTCGDEATGDDFGFDVELVSNSGTESLDLEDLVFSGGSDGGTLCGATGFEQTFLVCGRFTYPSFGICDDDSPEVNATTTPELVYDALAPGAPTLQAVTPFDGALSVRVAADADTTAVVLFAKEESQPDTSYAEVARFAASSGVGRIDNLTNGIAYSVQAFAEDEVENRSAGSAVLTGIPIDSEGFFGNYQRQGGAEEGGCSTTGAGTAAALALLGIGALSRRRRQ